MTAPEPAATSAADPIRDRLLDAAASVFASKGYAGTRIVDIVKAAGLSSGALYGRYESKGDLLLDAVVRQVEANASARRFEGLSVPDLLIRSNRAAGPLEDVEAMQLEAFIAARREPQVAEAIAQSRRRWRATVTQQLVTDAIAEGTASPDADFDLIIYFLETLHLGLLVQRGAGQEAADAERWMAFLRGVLRQISRPDRGPRGAHA